MHGNVLAIDQGTSGTKALVLDADLAVLSCVEAAVRPTTYDGGLAEHDPHALLASVIDTGRRALAESGVEVDAVALANQGETVLAWDRDTGTPLSPMLVWHDRRAKPVCDRLRDHEDELHAITGLPLDAYFGAPKMAWIRDNVTSEGIVSSSDAWLVNRLTGECVTDVSTASRMLLAHVDGSGWSGRALEIFGLTPESMPRIVGNLEVVGTTDAFGPRGLPVTGLVVDQQAALLGQRCLQPGDTKCTYGTGAFLLAHTGFQPVLEGGGLVPSVAWRTGDRTEFCVDGQVLTAGSAVSWLRDMGWITGPEDLDRLSQTVRGSEGVTFVPSFAGLAAPQWNPDARAQVRGLSLAHGPGHLVRAFVEGLAALVADLADAATTATGMPLTALRVDGGLTRSRALMQAQADLVQAPVQVHASPHATALGAGILALAYSRGTTDLASVAPETAPAEEFVPVMSHDDAAEVRDRVRAACADEARS